MRAALIASIALLGACAGDDGHSGPIIDARGDSGSSLDAGAWLETYIARLCTKAHSCKASYPSQQGETFEDVWGGDVSACKANFLTADQVRASVATGKTLYDADAGAQCLAMLPYDLQTCAEFWSTNDPAICGSVFRGTVTAGGACSNGLECQPGLSCISGTCTAGALPWASNLRRALAGR
jgi:hypothetical protein